MMKLESFYWIFIFFFFSSISFAFGQNNTSGNITTDGLTTTSTVNGIDFQTIINAPLQAINDAQAMLIKTSLDFVNDIGFVDINGTKSVRFFDLAYMKIINGIPTEYVAQIPFILMLPVPYIEIETISLNFNLKLESVSTASGSSQFIASMASQQTVQGELIAETYSIQISANAVAAPAPKSTNGLLSAINSFQKRRSLY